MAALQLDTPRGFFLMGVRAKAYHSASTVDDPVDDISVHPRAGAQFDRACPGLRWSSAPAPIPSFGFQMVKWVAPPPVDPAAWRVGDGRGGSREDSGLCSTTTLA